jgi:hypothetical protein
MLLQIVDVIPLTVILVNAFRAIFGGTVATLDVDSECSQRNVIYAGDFSGVLGGYFLSR